MKEIFKVKSQTYVSRLAGAIASCTKEGTELEIQAIGAAAVNQSVKAVAKSRGYLVPTGVDLTISPAFKELDIDGQAMTAIVMEVRVI